MHSLTPRFERIPRNLTEYGYLGNWCPIFQVPQVTSNFPSVHNIDKGRIESIFCDVNYHALNLHFLFHRSDLEDEQKIGEGKPMPSIEQCSEGPFLSSFPS
jgi:hypothetical protein